jgi:SAM-dependent methyltransferase
MAQIDSGLRSVLGIARVFELFKSFVNRPERYRWFVQEHVGARDGERLLDIGCGTADVLDHLPSGVDYVGFDLNPRYIEVARQRRGHRGRFYCERVDAEHRFDDHTFDVVLALGVLHHLDDDEAVELFRLAARCLRPGGRLVTIDGCYRDGQPAIARYLLSRDRGRNVRTEPGYTELASRVFGRVEATLFDDLLRFPYTHLSLRCYADGGSPR